MSGVMLLWLVVGTGLIVSELATGTFYLLVFGFAAWAGATAAWFGFDVPVQIGVSGAAAIVGLAILIPYDMRRRAGAAKDAGDLDIGNDVHVEDVGAGGRLRVNYRGAGWDAVVDQQTGLAPKVGDVYVITAVRGNTLVVRRAA